jgi:hypothetical protein
MTTHAQIPVDTLHGVTPSMFNLPPGRVPTYLPCQIDHRKHVVTVTLKAGNGYTHHLRADIEDLPFLKRCWPFEVSTGGKRKKIVKRIGKVIVPLHKLWLMYKHDLQSRYDFNRVPKCTNQDWLDWTNDNVYLPDTNRASQAKREAWISSYLSPSAKELIQARAYGDRENPFPEGVSGFGREAVAWMFRDAARIPVQPAGIVGED